MNNNKIYEGALFEALVTNSIKRVYNPILEKTIDKVDNNSDEIHAVLLTLGYGIIKVCNHDNMYCVLNINNDKIFKENIIKLNKLGNKSNFIFLSKGDWSKTILTNDNETLINNTDYDAIDFKTLMTANYETYERCSINAKRVINNRASNILKKLFNR